VYSASAAAAPLLFEKAREPHLSAFERGQVLWLIVNIGLGEDGTWEGYTTEKEMRDAHYAVALLAPAFLEWAAENKDAGALAAGIALAAYFPAALDQVAVELSDLRTDALDPRLAAASQLVESMHHGPVSEPVVRRAANADLGTASYYAEMIDYGWSTERLGRLVVVELVERFLGDLAGAKLT